VPDSVFQQQMEVLNTQYADAGISFTFAGLDRAINEDWFFNSGLNETAQTDMKNHLRKGNTPTTLDVYTVRFAGQWRNLLGYSSFPWEYESAPQDDGVVLNFLSLPGGAAVNFNKGYVSLPVTLSTFPIAIALTLLLVASARSWTLGRTVPHFPWMRSPWRFRRRYSSSGSSISRLSSWCRHLPRRRRRCNS
jgi:hypothetical protein